MSQPQFLYCPCWDPWKTGCKGLLKAKTGELNQKPKVRFRPRTYVQPLRSREPQDISKEFEEEVIPGFTLSHSKEHINVILGEDFFEKKTTTEQPAKPKLVVPSTPPKPETEDVVADLVEQISELTAMMEQLRRDHQVTHKQVRCFEQSLTRKFELEIEEQKKLIQKNSFLIGKAYEQEREVCELKEKNETLNAIASALHKTELELRNEVRIRKQMIKHLQRLSCFFSPSIPSLNLKKANLLEMEKNIQQRIATVEEKHRISMATLVEENVILR
ncbi:hypothetical protein JD844_023172 [Phrynosoma platyrhinos]|uniref:Uncharacterized protein n=1 Tax=Phrynosoma platyrhinos TaxID=52577 RepID=A0ABQ7SW79_PHRPL|nr:hypothetical protein JD844_023172 [Phrynosoma platyrhinos]